MLNSTELKEIITNVTNSDCIQQVGIDLELINIYSLRGAGGVYKNKKTELPISTSLEIEEHYKYEGVKGWLIRPGYYQLEFDQGCDIPKDVTLLIRQRSSLLRNGGQIHSSIFDPGFKTINMITYMQVYRPLFIEKGARVAQIYGHRNTEVEVLYDGQFQNDRHKGQ